ncbi:MAG: hypothetical protein RLY93_16315 [Sumerlaeia bacterium]
MIYEFAIDPDLFTSFERLRYYESHLGFDKGRFVAQFPENWLFLIWKRKPTATGLSDFKLTEKLARLKKYALLDSNRTYDPAFDWQQNAVSSHTQRAFKAIIAESNPENNPVITTDKDVDTASGPFAVEQQITIRRTARNVADLIVRLSITGPRIVLVDPHFTPAIGRRRGDPSQTYRTPWYHLLEELSAVLPQGVTLEYHTLRKSNRGSHPLTGIDDAQDRSEWLVKCQEMRTHMPSVMPFRVVRWQEKPCSDVFHARYALTERAGLLVESGLDTNRAWFQREMPIILMQAALHLEQWQRFGKRIGPFQLVDEHVV